MGTALGAEGLQCRFLIQNHVGGTPHIVAIQHILNPWLGGQSVKGTQYPPLQPLCPILPQFFFTSST